MSTVRFVRIHGRIVPIREKSSLKTNKAVLAGATALSVASGVLSGLTMFSGAKKATLGFAGSTALDIGSGIGYASSVQGSGSLKDRSKKIGRNALIGEAAGYGAMGLSIALHKPSREAAIQSSKAAINAIKALGSRVFKYGVR